MATPGRDEKHIDLIASNLTAAFYSHYSRESDQYTKEQITEAILRARRSQGVMEIFNTFNSFREKLRADEP